MADFFFSVTQGFMIIFLLTIVQNDILNLAYYKTNIVFIGYDCEKIKINMFVFIKLGPKVIQNSIIALCICE